MSASWSICNKKAWNDPVEVKYMYMHLSNIFHGAPIKLVQSFQHIFTDVRMVDGSQNSC